MERISFNKPHLSGMELEYIAEAVNSKRLSGNGSFTKRCQEFFQYRYNFKKCLLTNSCTDALEMAAILADIKEGDEVIIPSYTFVSTANAFLMRGAKVIFADSSSEHPGINEDLIESLITPKTRAVVPVHYAGVACDMKKIMELAEKYNLFIIEDAAQAIDSYYIDPGTGEKKALGSFGHMATFSFHDTKNIISGEGGMLVINDNDLHQRAEIIWEKGTNRSAFFRGEVDKYGWVDVGSSFLPSEITAAFLWAQLESLEKIQNKRKLIWEEYFRAIHEEQLEEVVIPPSLPSYATNNAHMFYLICRDEEQRQKLIKDLKIKNIQAVFHYQSLHKSIFYQEKHDGRNLPNADRYSNVLVRLPFYYDLSIDNVRMIVSRIKEIADN